ncbi:MAG: ATP-binding cassette domain-containing protein [Mesorhizobium sp.]|nr:MAG: ATP-binding cassette domain-containing protein [Mesorhizobium sp.]
MSEPLLAVRDLHAWYGEGHALHGVNLEVLRGETVTLLGRNGVGKTTTLRALKERRNSQGTKLSGGEQQMLAIARILRTGVEMLLLDEPTEGLAPVIVQRIGELLATLKKRGMTILLVEQNFRFAARIADRFYLMDHGKVVEGFPVGQLSAHTEKLHEVLGV